MKIERIQIENFRGITTLDLNDLGNTIVIAGANGSGKSCIFDAIRLLKSAYGGYQANEWHHWMAEFQINWSNNAESFSSFFQDKSKPLSIKCVIRIHPKEREYIQAHGKELVRNSIWRIIAPEMYGWSSYRAAPMAAQYRTREPEVAAATEVQWAELTRELSEDTIEGHLWCTPGGQLQFRPSKALEILFSTFMPGDIGLIDYHGPQRMYVREQVANVNLDLDVQEQQNKNNALYNYNNKYTGVKAEMAASYLKELLAEKAGVEMSEQSRISNTLTELFKTFFPDKQFLGLTPTIDGALTFPVRTASGSVHDLNELSAGEKEVLYGYLRIRNSAPRYSVILIDEPELHLNPRLVQDLPGFYHEHLGSALDNQIWLVTHSDTLLRAVVGRPEYSVFHMTGAGMEPGGKQIRRLTLVEDTERAVISLVGDIAAYRPGKKVVIFEGGGDSEFDVYMTTTLFPELSQNVNVISGGNKLRVRELHSVLEAASKKGTVPFKTFSITDSDSDTMEVSSPRFRWEVYHIENFLLDPSIVLKVMSDLKSSNNMNESDVYDKLRSSAKSTLDNIIRHLLRTHVNDVVLESLDFGTDPRRKDLGAAIFESIDRASQKLDKSKKSVLSADALVAKENELREQFTQDLGTDSWRKTFQGREILKKFAADHVSVGYETFRDLLIARMKDVGSQPPGMKIVVDEILKA